MKLWRGDGIIDMRDWREYHPEYLPVVSREFIRNFKIFLALAMPFWGIVIAGITRALGWWK